MEKKKLVLIGIAVVLVAGLVSWFFFFAEKKGKMDISQENQILEEMSPENQEVPEVAPVVEEITNKTPEQIVDEFKQEQQKPTETVIKPEEVIDKPVETKKSNSLDIVDRLVFSGFQKYSGTRKVDTVIIHSSYNSLEGDQYDVNKIIAIYKSYGVSAHYIIGRDGTAYRLVKDNDIAYHAGVSQVPDGRTDVNKFSIGIEIVGNKTDGYTNAQYSVVSDLVGKIKKDYDIKYVLGHNDIAPDRKDDPWKFNWDKLK